MTANQGIGGWLDKHRKVIYAIGTLVSHPVFGNGKIIEKSGSGDNLKLVVLFSNGQWKKLLAKFANLTILK